jgi:surface antigen
MSAQSSIVILAAIVITAFGAIGILLGSRGATAKAPAWQTRVIATATAPVMRRRLDANDEIAALERIQYALSEVGDGSTYAWRRWHGGLAGVVHPTASFKDDNGSICRHLVVLLTTGKRTSRMEGVACRLPSGRWRLDG